MSIAGGGGGGMMNLRSFARDRSVNEQRLQRGTWRRVLGYARPYRRLIIAVITLISVDALLVVAQPLLIRRIIDAGVVPGVMDIVVTGASLLAAIAVVEALVGILGRWLFARIGEGLIFDLRTQVFDHVQRQSIAFFTRTQTGALVQRLNGDVLGAQQAFTSTLNGVIGNLVSLTAILGAMLALSWSITLMALAMVPLFLIPARIVGKATSPTQAGVCLPITRTRLESVMGVSGWLRIGESDRSCGPTNKCPI